MEEATAWPPSCVAGGLAGWHHLTLVAGTLGIQAACEDKHAFPALLLSTRLKNKHPFFKALLGRMDRQSTGCRRSAADHVGGLVLPGLALSLCWVGLRTLQAERGAGAPAPGLKARLESQARAPPSTTTSLNSCYPSRVWSMHQRSDPLLGGAESTGFAAVEQLQFQQ